MNKTMINEKRKSTRFRKLFVICMMAILVLTQKPTMMSVSAQTTNEIHWAVADVRVPTGQNYADLVFVLDWGSVTPSAINAAILTLFFEPVGAFTLDSYSLAPGVAGFVTSYLGTIPTEGGGRSTISFTISGMNNFEGEVELRVRLQIEDLVLRNVGDYVTMGVIRAAMAGNPATVTAVTVVRCDCGNGCSLCDDAGGSGPPVVNGGSGNGGTGNGGTGNGGTGGGTGNGGTGGGTDNGGTGGGTGNGGTGGGTGNGGTGGGGGTGSGGSGSGDTSLQPRQPSGVEPGQTPGSGISRFVPWTGDDANLTLWLTLFGVGLLGIIGVIIALIVTKKKSKKPTIVVKGHGGDEDSIISK